MEFDFKYKLGKGAELTVSAEVNEKDTLITGISCGGRDGCLSADRLDELSLSFPLIEALAFERYQECRAQTVADRKAAGIAGEEVA